jgi:hypothetical protein
MLLDLGKYMHMRKIIYLILIGQKFKFVKIKNGDNRILRGQGETDS